jgi:hypothetical protein
MEQRMLLNMAKAKAHVPARQPRVKLVVQREEARRISGACSMACARSS